MSDRSYYENYSAYYDYCFRVATVPDSRPSNAEGTVDFLTSLLARQQYAVSLSDKPEWEEALKNPIEYGVTCATVPAFVAIALNRGHITLDKEPTWIVTNPTQKISSPRLPHAGLLLQTENITKAIHLIQRPDFAPIGYGEHPDFKVIIEDYRDIRTFPSYSKAQRKTSTERVRSSRPDLAVNALVAQLHQAMLDYHTFHKVIPAIR